MITNKKSRSEIYGAGFLLLLVLNYLTINLVLLEAVAVLTLTV